jgi:hypothetical protein
LYLISPKAWEFCLQHIVDFAKHKGFYTEEFVAERLEEIKVARAIPNNKIRKDETNTNRVFLDEAISNCCDMFKALKSLIQSAFTTDLLPVKYNAAGQSFYNKAYQGNQSALNDLNDSALQFIKNNDAALKANNNMSATFLNDYKAVIATYNTQRTTYDTSVQELKELTQENTIANNAIYKKMMDMFADAKIVFKKEPDIANQFSFTYFYDLVTSPSVAGIRGKVTNLADNKAIYKAVITVLLKDKSVETNKYGKFDIIQLANGIYTIVITAEGFKTVTIDKFEVKTGVYNTLNVVMEKMENVIVL